LLTAQMVTMDEGEDYEIRERRKKGLAEPTIRRHNIMEIQIHYCSV